MDSAIEIGGSVKIENVTELGQVIVSILNTTASDQVKIEALEALSAVAKVESVTIQNCRIDTGKTINVSDL